MSSTDVMINGKLATRRLVTRTRRGLAAAQAALDARGIPASARQVIAHGDGWALYYIPTTTTTTTTHKEG